MGWGNLGSHVIGPLSAALPLANTGFVLSQNDDPRG